MNRKKIIVEIVSLVFIGALVLAGPANAQGLGFKIRLYGGLGYLSGGDLNEGLKGYPNVFTDAAHAFGYSLTGEYSGAHLGPVFGGDLILQITPMFGIGLGTNYIQASKVSTITVASPMGSNSLTTTPKLHAIPLKFSFFLSIPSSAVTVNFHAGIGYYIATASAELRLADMGGWEDVLSETNSKGGIGFHGGIGLEFNVAPHVALFIEAQGQYASISGFDGKMTDSFSGGFSMSENGKLFYYEEKMFLGSYYPWVIIRSTQPSGILYQNVREAKVDFSGGEMLGGIVIKF